MHGMGNHLEREVTDVTSFLGWIKVGKRSEAWIDWRNMGSDLVVNYQGVPTAGTEETVLKDAPPGLTPLADI